AHVPFDACLDAIGLRSQEVEIPGHERSLAFHSALALRRAPASISPHARDERARTFVALHHRASRGPCVRASSRGRTRRRLADAFLAAADLDTEWAVDEGRMRASFSASIQLERN